MKKGTRILLTGGGTAGHVNPALAIGAALAEPGSETLFVGVRGRAEEQVVPREGIPIRFVRASGFPGARPSAALARFAFDLAVGTLQAVGVLLRFRPDVIVGTGGFASAPVVFAATFLKRLRLSRGSGYDGAADVEDRLRARYGPEERERIATFHVARSYFHDIASVYALADLVVVRGGSGSLNELARMGLPALVVPKANLPGDHQVANARALERAGGAEVLYEETTLADGHLVEELDGRLLARRILALAADPERLAEMSRRGRDVLGIDAAAEIAHHVRLGRPTGVVDATLVPAPAVVSNAALLSRLEKACAAAGARYRVEDHVEPRDLAWFRSRAASLLVNEEWEARNLGVKLLGLLEAKEKVPLILALLADRTPAPLLQRLLGGDFAQVGFVRRNAVTALGRLGVVDDGVEEALLAAFSDPYWEVRSEAARAATRLGGRLRRRSEVVAALAKGLSDRNLDAAAAAAEALGALGGETDALPALLRLADYRFWKVRAAALRGVLALVERGEVKRTEMLRESLPAFLLTSTDFRPQFEMKLSYRRVVEALSRGKESSR